MTNTTESAMKNIVEHDQVEAVAHHLRQAARCWNEIDFYRSRKGDVEIDEYVCSIYPGSIIKDLNWRLARLEEQESEWRPYEDGYARPSFFGKPVDARVWRPNLEAVMSQIQALTHIRNRLLDLVPELERWSDSWLDSVGLPKPSDADIALAKQYASEMGFELRDPAKIVEKADNKS